MLCIPPATPGNSRPEIPASPPRYVSLEELMAAAKGMTQMSLAHEIAINEDFKLEPQEPKSSLEKLVKDTIHKAFWDKLEAELNAEPASYEQALVLLEEVKSGLLDLLLPQHSRIRLKITEVLDMDLIKQQAEKGTLLTQYLEYAQFVISIMGKLCAPVRDEKIAELTQTKEIVPLFRGILDTIKLMKVDMANFTIDVMRPTIIANSVAYEKKKFADFLKVNPDGLARTKQWLKKHISVASDDSVEMGKRIEAVLNRAFLDLVQWPSGENLPESLTMDEARISENTETLVRLTRIGAILLLAFSHAGRDLTSILEWKQQVKQHVSTLVTDGLDAATIGTKISADIGAAVQKYNVSGHCVTGLSDALQGVYQPDHRIYSLLHTRILEFLMQAIASNTAERLRIPPGLSVLQEEVTKLTGNFLRMVSYNRQVFGEHYVDIITELLTAEDAQPVVTPC